MKTLSHRLNIYRPRIARVILAVFVMAWVNLVLQAPVHAAMKMRHDMPCHCTHTLCDTVLGMQDQSDDGVSSVMPVMADIADVFQVLPAVLPSASMQQQFRLAANIFHDTSPPPLTLTGVLRI